MNSRKKIGLVLTSGGARGAYQVGSLKAIEEILKTPTSPFSILSGVSAGSLNCGFLGCYSHDFPFATQKLEEVWSNLKVHDVFKTDGLTLTSTGLSWISDLGLGGFIGSGRSKSLLKTEPLRQLVNSLFERKLLEQNFHSGLLEGLAFTATNYLSGTAVTFFEGKRNIKPWIRSTRMALHEALGVDHIMASSAIPIFFPAVSIAGTFYGDGCIRMNTPLSPAIHMGADKILAIGVRHERSIESVDQINTANLLKYPYLADVIGVLLNSMFLDALDADIERLQRINRTVSLIPAEKYKQEPNRLRNIPTLALKPSQNLGELALEVAQELPYAVRHFLKGIGASGSSGLDLISYLAFDSSYTTRLVELGYQDALSLKTEILRFFEM